MKLVGRQKEREILGRVRDSGEPEFVAIYGRRRIGKTFLIREFFGEELCFEVTGIHGASTATQLRSFGHELTLMLEAPMEIETPASWQEAFRILETGLTAVLAKRKGRVVVFFDEMPWLDTHRSGFLKALGHFWSTWGSRQKQLVLVAGGSAARWMIRKVLRDRGDLRDQVTRQLRLEPFSLAECEQYFRQRGVGLTRPQICEIVMVTGGLPHYLKEVEEGKSAAQCIESLCFSDVGVLRDEFEEVFPSHFARPANHRAVVKALAGAGNGLTRNDLVEITGVVSGGGLTSVLKELEEAGFVGTTLPFGKKSNDQFYRLEDAFSLFSLRWMGKGGKKRVSWDQVVDRPTWRAWARYAFGSVCRQHVQQMKAALGIAAVDTEESAWSYNPPASAVMPEAQIDLLIDRRDDCINLCTHKFAGGPFAIDRKEAERLRRTQEVFRQVSGSRKALRLTLVTPHGVHSNAYAKELVQSEVVLDDLFEVN